MSSPIPSTHSIVGRTARISTVIKDIGKLSWLAILVIIASVILAVVTVVVGVHRPSNALATGLLQAFTVILTTIAAYTFARPAADSAAQELIKTHARSAFRRQKGLYMGLGRLIDEIDLQVVGTDDEMSQLRLKILRAMIVEQAGTSGDALDDWRDLVPEEVALLEEAPPEEVGREKPKEAGREAN
jgi:hypothetical protein